MNVKRAIGRASVAVLGLLALTSLSGCAKEPYMLGIMGYNYTDRVIADFSVNGQPGSNVFLSDEVSGGGKLACCVVLSRKTKTPFWIEVVYQMSALESYSPRKIIEPSGRYVKVRVRVDGPIPPDPRYLEIHFYPDRHIEAAISGRDGPLSPRLKLKTRSDFAR